jgi:hypothetical protein
MGDLSTAKADAAKAEAVVSADVNKATIWTAAHARDVVIAALVGAVIFILHKIL